MNVEGKFRGRDVRLVLKDPNPAVGITTGNCEGLSVSYATPPYVRISKFEITAYPPDGLDADDGTPFVSGSGATFQEALDDLTKKLDDVASWAADPFKETR